MPSYESSMHVGSSEEKKKPQPARSAGKKKQDRRRKPRLLLKQNESNRNKVERGDHIESSNVISPTNCFSSHIILITY